MVRNYLILTTCTYARRLFEVVSRRLFVQNSPESQVFVENPARGAERPQESRSLETDTGFQIHDYLAYNPSSVTVLQKRERAKNRQETHRQRKPVTALVTRDKVRDTKIITPLVTRDSRARGTPPHPTPVQQVRTHTETSSTSAGERHASVWWHDLWLKRWPEGIPQLPHTRVVDLERLEAQLGLDDLTARMARYLDDDAEWLLKHKHPVATFITRINSYDVEGPPDRPESRIRNCPQCHHPDGRGHDDRCDHCDWTRAAWEEGNE